MGILPAYEEDVEARKNARVLKSDASRMVYEIDGVEGSGTVEVLPLFPGVLLQIHNFDCRSFHLPTDNNIGGGLKINYCMEGRAEVRMSDNLCLFMKPGNLSLDVRTAQSTFQFPGGHYHGVELFLQDAGRPDAPPAVWGALGIDLAAIRTRFCGGGQGYAIYADERFKALFAAMMDAPPECRLCYLQLKTTELLLLLQYSALPETSDISSLMTMGQVEIAKQIMEQITRDLSRHYSVEELAAPFHISASSVKNYFQGVFGKNISAYLRGARMSGAAKSLRGSNLPVAEIASAAGYENASKFSAAFKTFFGVSPLEYRRQSRCGI